VLLIICADEGKVTNKKHKALRMIYVIASKSVKVSEKVYGT
jgi:hypothetical protein